MVYYHFTMRKMKTSHKPQPVGIAVEPCGVY
jgi:hypothetical protein